MDRHAAPDRAPISNEQLTDFVFGDASRTLARRIETVAQVDRELRAKLAVMQELFVSLLEKIA